MAQRMRTQEGERDLGQRGALIAVIATIGLLYLGHLAITGAISHPLTYGFIALFTAVATFAADFMMDRGILERDMLIFYFVAVAGIVLLIVGAVQRGLLPLAYIAPLQEAALGSAALYAALIVAVILIALVFLVEKGKLSLPLTKHVVSSRNRFVKHR
ncbi:MAG: hypothetical protein QXT28_13170 [Thermofilaceae archaeon]